MRKLTSDTGLSPSAVPLSRGFSSTAPCNIAALQPRRGRNLRGLGSSPVARHDWGNHGYFLFLRVLRCFSSPGSPPQSEDAAPSARRVVPFGNPRVEGHLHLTAAYRSLSRPSSPVRAKASAVCPYLLLPYLPLIRQAVFERPAEKGQGMSYSLYLPDAVYSTTGMLVNFTVARVQYVNERNHIYNHRRRKGRKSQAMPERGRHRPRQEPFQKNRASPERRCSSRTFRYGYLVTT